MTGLVLRISGAAAGRVREIPVGGGDMPEALRLLSVVADLPSVRSGRRRVEIVPAGGDR